MPEVDVDTATEEGDDDTANSERSYGDRLAEFNIACKDGCCHGGDTLYQRNDTCGAGFALCMNKEEALMDVRCMQCGYFVHRMCFRLVAETGYDTPEEEQKGFCLRCLEPKKDQIEIPDYYHKDPLSAQSVSIMLDGMISHRVLPISLLPQKPFEDAIRKLLLEVEEREPDEEYKDGKEEEHDEDDEEKDEDDGEEKEAWKQEDKEEEEEDLYVN